MVAPLEARAVEHKVFLGTLAAPEQESEAAVHALFPQARLDFCLDGWHSFRGNCYILVNSPETWNGAENYCGGFEASLASVHNLWDLCLDGRLLLPGHRIAYTAAVVVRNKLYSFGGPNNYLYSFGRSNRDQIEVLIFNPVCFLWRKLPPATNGRGECPIEVPFERYHHTAVLVEEFVYIWGGYIWGGGPYCNVLYAFDVDTHSWFKPNISGIIPEARTFHSACVLGNVMYIYGGDTMLTGRTSDIYKLDTTTMVWALINTRGTPPPISSSHSATIIGTKMFVFGGLGAPGVVYNNIRVFDTETNCWLSMPSEHLLPEERCDHSAFAYNGELYIFGGWNWFQNLYDLWKFSQETFSWKQIKPKGKGPCRLRGMCGCMVGDNVIFFGGYKEYEDYKLTDDQYMLNLNNSLKRLCKLSVIHYGLDQSELPHNIKWELENMPC